MLVIMKYNPIIALLLSCYLLCMRYDSNEAISFLERVIDEIVKALQNRDLSFNHFRLSFLFKIIEKYFTKAYFKIII